MHLSSVVIKVLEDNEASLGIARNLGAVEVGSERSESTRPLVVFRLTLSD